MVVYADVVWLLNFSVDFLLILLTAGILKKRWKWYRVTASAFVGSLVVLVTLTPFANVMAQPLSKILISLFMILLAFGYGRFRTFIQTVFMFYFATVAVGGGIMGLHYFLQTDMIIQNGAFITNSNQYGDPVSWIFVVAALPLVFYFAKGRIEDVQIRKVHFDQLVSVEIKLEDKLQHIKGLIDSGNQLSDPLTQTPVMILDIEKVRGVIPEWLWEKTKSSYNLDFSVEEKSSSIFQRIRIIPYRVVGQQHNFLFAIRPDYVKICTKDGELCVTKVLIGLSHMNLSAEGDYECILHPKMIQTAEISA